MDGLVILDKPSGVGSTDMVRRSKRWFNERKVGHAGTLDPLASGLLVICLGQATRYAQYFLNAHKRYQVTLKLGECTDTLDSDGQVVSSSPIPMLSAEQFESIRQKFLGEQSQVPPMYSALKKDGKPLYELARQGQTVERQPRQVTIFELELLRFEVPFIQLEVHCSKGTYIRSLVHDIGAHIGCGAHVTALRRLASYPFTSQMMTQPEAIEKSAISERHAFVMPIETALSDYARIDLTLAQWEALKQGRHCSIELSEGLKTLFFDQQFVGLGSVSAEQVLKVQRLLKI